MSKRLLIATVAVAGLVFAAGGSSADTFSVRLVSQTSSTITLGWDPQPGYGYLFSGDGNLVSRTNDPNRAQVRFSKQYSVFDIDVIAKGANGHYPTAAPPPKPACSDTIDNDGDGLIDLADPGCASPTDTDESNVAPPSPQCSDGKDNDNDGKIDLADPGCASPTDNDETDSVSGQVTLTPVDGGTNYYNQFTNGAPMSAPGFFPIGGWLRPAGTAAQFAAYAAFGMNTFVGVENPEGTDEAAIRAAGMKAIIQSDERTRFNGLGSETVGYLLHDEIDMQCGPPCDGYGQLDQVLAGLPNDGRFRYNNYGKGVLEWESDSEAATFVNGRNGPNSFQQVTSADYYWFTDPNVNGSQAFGSKYGDNVTRLRFLDAMDGVRQPIWMFVELGWPFTEGSAQGGRRILPAEIRSAVWHSIIAGARGIIYFDHNFGPGTPGSTIMGEGYDDNQAMATSVDSQIQSLATVLNSPTVTSGTSSSDTMNGTVRMMTKWNGQNFYVFVGADRGAGSASVSIPCVGNATAAVLGENRTVPVTNGSFTDQFADKNSVHIYRVDGGSRCGL